MELIKTLIWLIPTIGVVGFIIVAYCCFNDNDPDQDWYNAQK